MPRCPNTDCSYLLVFIERRNRYKCAKCGKTYTKTAIDNKEFREWNAQQREKDKQEIAVTIEKDKKGRRKSNREPDKRQKPLTPFFD